MSRKIGPCLLHRRHPAHRRVLYRDAAGAEGAVCKRLNLERKPLPLGCLLYTSCPDCGAPYHRVCYEKLGQCIHRPAHAAGYEWKFPYEESQLRTCPSCGERTLRDEETCRCCGAVPVSYTHLARERRARRGSCRGRPVRPHRWPCR